METKIVVCEGETHSSFFLRIHFGTADTGTLRFESEKAYTKHEADYRAVVLAAKYGFKRDELPTHPKIEAYPKLESI